jgi:hypothetical protein
MAIEQLTNGSVIVHMKVDYTADNLAEIQSAVSANQALYAGKVLKAKDTGRFHYVDQDGVISNGQEEKFRAFNGDGNPASISEGRVSMTITANTDNLAVTNGVDKCAVLLLDNSTGNRIELRGLEAAATTKTLILYNTGNAAIRLKNNNANANVNNRFDINGNFDISRKRGVWLFYDKSTNKWRILNK